ncbi:MAG TPA: hypothetical protein VN685_09085 [Rhizomicrobium sp.]|nr:hypothetical protein [Rhizomicrobium sp.]
MRAKLSAYPLAAALVLAVATPSIAATYYVAQSSKTKHCLVTSRKPNGTTMMRVGSDTYASKADARTAMKSASDCSK